MADTSVHRYRGVLCYRCNQPIALPAIISRLEEESRLENNEAAEQFSARVFTIRCGTCGREYPYPASVIIEVEGTPQAQLTRADGARAFGGQFSREMARAARAS